MTFSYLEEKLLACQREVERSEVSHGMRSVILLLSTIIGEIDKLKTQIHKMSNDQ